MAAAIPAAGLVAGMMENDKNRRAAASSRDAALQAAQQSYMLQKPLVDRKVALFDTIKGMVDNAKARGQFNPDWLLQQLNNDSAQSISQQTRGLTSNLRSLGYRPGDSEVGVRLDSIIGKGMADRDRLATDTRQSAFMNELAAYNSINDGPLTSAAQMIGSNADRQMGINMNMAGMYQGMMQNPASLIAALMPFLQQKKQATSSNALYEKEAASNGSLYNWLPDLQYQNQTTV